MALQMLKSEKVKNIEEKVSINNEKTICTKENGSFENGTLSLIQPLSEGRGGLDQGSR